MPISLKILVEMDSSSPTQRPGEISQAYTILNVWPEREDVSAPKHTPDHVAKRFIEGQQAFLDGRWHSAVAMFRSSLDIATKHIPDTPTEGTFFKRLEWLHQNNLITKEMKQWADHVRVDGNAALHDPDDFTREDAAPLRLFTEMFLRYLFELPGEVASYRQLMVDN